MARKSFRGSARAKGFSVPGFSNAAEQRIAQQTARVVRGMEEYRDSDIRNRTRILKDMEDNAEYTRRAEDKNRQIEDQNLQNEIAQSKADAATSLQQYQIDARESALIFKTVADFSDTAAKAAQEFEQRKVDEQYWEGVRQRQLEGPFSIQQVKYDAFKDTEGIATAEVAGSIDMAAARGANELAVSKARNMTYWQSQGWQDQNILSTTKASWNSFRDSGLMNSPELIQLPDGSQFKVNESKGDTGKVAASIAYLQRQFIEQAGFAGLSPERLGTALDYMQVENQKAIAQQAAMETKRNQEELRMGAMNVFGSGAINPIDANNSFNALVRANEGDFRKTFTELESGVSKGLIEPEALAGIIMPDGRPLSQHARFEHIQNLATKADIDAIELDASQRKAEHKQKSNEWLAYFDSNPDATKADLDAAAASFAGDVQGVPEWLKKRIRYQDPTGQAQGDFIIEMAEDAAGRGTLTNTIINKVYEVNPAKAMELSEKLAKQNQFTNNDAFKEYYASLEGLVKKQVDATDTPNSVDVLRFLQKNFQEEVTKKVAAGMSIEDAAREAAFEIQGKVVNESANEDSQYYRVFDPTTMTWKYPNFERAAGPAGTKKEANYELAQKLLSKSGTEVQSLLRTPGAIYQNEELETIHRDFTANPASFKIPGAFQILARRTGESPMVLLNRVMANQIGKEIAVTPSMALLNEASPRAKALLQKFRSVNRSTRGLGETSNGFNSGAIQPVYVPMIEQAATTYNVPAAEISALAEIESGFQPERPSYNNSSFGMMQINKSAHPEFFANNDWRDPEANINYGAKYYSDLKKMFGGDPVAAAMAYNAGPGNYAKYLAGTLPDGPIKTEMLNHGRKFSNALYKYQGNSSGMLSSPTTMREGSPLHRSFTRAIVYNKHPELYTTVGDFLKDELKFKVAEHSAYGGVNPVHAGNSYHDYDEAFDVTHWNGQPFEKVSKAKTIKLKEAIRSLGLFDEVIGPGDGDPNHETHLHLGGLMRPMTEEDSQTLKSLLN